MMRKTEALWWLQSQRGRVAQQLAEAEEALRVAEAELADFLEEHPDAER